MMACDCESRPVRMATLLKRWKMRMLGKYKHLSGVTSDSECRRSESSLKSAVSASRAAASDAGSGRHQSRTAAAQQCQGSGSCASFPRMSARRRAAAALKTSDRDAAERRPTSSEFSFTLYDLDGRGRVTQDDIAGLVRTIYDLVGSSMDVPAGAGKTINVRLTVVPDPPPAQTEEAGSRRVPLALSPCASRRSPSQTAATAATTAYRRRHLAPEPPAKRHLTELLRYSMEKNNVTYGNVSSYGNLKRSHTCREHVRHGPRPDATCRPVEVENHYCTVGELYCPNAAAAAAAGRPRRRASLRRAAPAPAPTQRQQQQQDDYELLTRCAEFALRAEAARQRPRRGGGGGGGGTEPPLPPRPVEHHHRHEHVHQHYHHYPSNVVIL